MLTVEHTTARTKVLCRNFSGTEKVGDAFLSRIISSDESRIRHYDSLTKRQSMEWYE